MTKKTKGRVHQRGATPEKDTTPIITKASRLSRQPKRTWQRGRRG